MNELHLLLPGLFASGKALGISSYPRLPALERFLGRAKVEPFEGVDLDSTLCGLFHVLPPAGCDLPTGAITRFALKGNAEGTWAEASPVYLRPDQSRLLLFDAESLDIQPDEAESLVELFNGHFAAEGYRLELGSAGQWLLSLPDEWAVKTHGLNDVVGFNMDHFLAEGADARRWRSLLNETQMLFHHAEVNAARERLGRPPISGAWFHGFGRLPEVCGAGFALAETDYPLARGLAALSQGEPSPSRELLVRSGLLRPALNTDRESWLGGLSTVEDTLAEVTRAIRARSTEVCYLYPCNGRRLRLGRKDLGKFWSRSKPLSAWTGN